LRQFFVTYQERLRDVARRSLDNLFRQTGQGANSTRYAGTDKSDQSLKSELKYLKLIWFTG